LVGTIALQDMTTGLILKRLLWSCRWPLSALTLGFLACIVLATMTGDPVLFRVSLWLLMHALCLLSSFLVHEMFHVVGMRLFRGVSHVLVSASVLRFSVVPVGSLYGWQIAIVAVLGPGSSCLLGAVLALLTPGSLLQYWFLLHAIFVLPFFGDGRCLVLGIREWARLVGLPAPVVRS
jgi:hypothetical protein